MEGTLYETILELSKKHPNDFEFGNKVRELIVNLQKQQKEFGTITYEVLQKLPDPEQEKWKPTDDELKKLEKYLNNLESN
jgi:hypothetical protein